jgi:DUF971 family protein
MEFSPIDVQVNLPEQRLRIIWADQHQSDYPLFGLRTVCPCVECRGGHEHMGAGLDVPTLRKPPPGRIGVTRLEAVGNYALQIFWDDGHQTGIYTWRMLREACPCDLCRC